MSVATELLGAAEEAARRAGAILASKFGTALTIEYKGGIDLVTDADKASEASILEFLRARFPDHAVLAEESGTRRGEGFRWIVDPLDGTTNYAHRVPHFCVSIAVENDEGLQAGVILDPLRNECFAASRGGGATLNAAPIRVTTKDSLDEALLCTGFPYDVRENPAAPVGLFNRLITRAQGLRRMGSAALDLAYVACGRFDGFFEFGLKPWDIAAGALIIQEAGGRMTRIDGAPLDLAIGDVLASGPGLYDRLLAETGTFLEQIQWTPRPR
ncbi:MAG: inositol monophosphatase [Myxococcaceae bacterium]|nr:inositol monophosphatase [Myxococcaceae bacterium]